MGKIYGDIYPFATALSMIRSQYNYVVPLNQGGLPSSSCRNRGQFRAGCRGRYWLP